MADIRIMKAVEWDKLAATFKRQNKDVGYLARMGWWIQPKYDGVFGMAIIRNSAKLPLRSGDLGTQTHEMLSRTGELMLSCDHILDELEEAVRDVDGDDWEQRVFLGELWHPKLSFPTISGKSRQHKPAPELMFVANDLLDIDLNTDVQYDNRFAKLCKYLPEMPTMCSTMVTDMWTSLDISSDGLMESARSWVEKGGYDGLILRDPYAGYKIGLVKHGQIVKVKPQTTYDLAVTSIGSTVGEKTGRAVYTLSVCYRGVTTWVGSGVPHNPDDLPVVGAIIEVGCLGVTESGALREPRFLRIRDDKEIQDT